MKRIFLLRHATAPRLEGQSDRERALNEKGKRESFEIGVYMNNNNYKPDLVLSSDSPRTTDTFNILNKLLTLKNIEFTNELYNVSSFEILEKIEGVDNSIESVMIVSHNPGVTSVQDIIGVKAALELMQRSKNYDVSGKLVVIDSECENWIEVSRSKNNIIDVFFPNS